MSMLAPTQGALIGKPDPSARPVQPPTHQYRDGELVRPLWLSPDLLAEFGPSATGEGEVLRLDPLAEQSRSSTGGARIWSTRSPLGAAELVRGLTRADLRCSPVWRTVNAQEGELLAFPGGVLLAFPASWSSAERRAFLLEHSLRELARPLDTEQLLLVDSPPGLEALELASRLANAARGVRSWPNTWRSYGSM